VVRIVTDNASDITLAEARELGLELVALETAFGDEPCPMAANADYDAFYVRLNGCTQLPTTSRPAPQKYIEIYEAARAAGDEVIVITLSSGLSGTYESACVAKNMAGYEKVEVIDSRIAVMAQRILTEHALRLRNEGRTAAEISAELEKLKERVEVVGVIGSLVNLRKGGRIPPALGIIGDALGIKPVITVRNGKIVDIGKARGHRAGVAASHKKLAGDGIDPDHPVIFGYTSDAALGGRYMTETAEKFNIPAPRLCQVNGIIGTHLGHDSVGVAYVRKK